MAGKAPAPYPLDKQDFNVSMQDVEGKKTFEEPLVAKGTIHTVGKGNWVNAAFFVCTCIAAPPAILPLPYAFAHLGWPSAIIGLLICLVVTCYTLNLLASLHTVGGVRRLRYRDIAEGVWGRKGVYWVAPFQIAVCVGSQITLLILFAESLQAIYLFYTSDPTITLWKWVAITGAIQAVLAMLPDFHSARWVNALATFSTISFSAIAFAMAIYDGKTAVDRSTVTYGVHLNPINKTFGVFSAFSIFAFAFGNAVLPETQATIREPCVQNMQKGIMAAYIIIACTYFGVGIAGYWAYGLDVAAFLLTSLTTPTWPITMAYLFVCLQILGCFLAYCGPIYEFFDNSVLEDHSKSRWALRNFIPRFVFRTSYIAFLSFISALLPFFGDFVNLVGALGFTPLNFILPCIMYIHVHKPKGPILYLQLTIIVVFTIIGTVAAVGAVRGIILDASTYKVFANL